MIYISWVDKYDLYKLGWVQVKRKLLWVVVWFGKMNIHVRNSLWITYVNVNYVRWIELSKDLKISLVR